MTEEAQTWNFRPETWQLLTARVAASGDTLEDGAFVRVSADNEALGPELDFYATALNRPQGWTLPFLEDIPGSARRGAFLGRAWHEPETGFVQFEVYVAAAAQSLTADYESGAADLDDVAYEQAVEMAVRGTPADLDWLHNEFARLTRTAGVDHT